MTGMNFTASTANVQDLPKISVVTVVFNGLNYIENTILSVLGQDYPNIEYIIVDGGSTDGTLEVIQRYEYRISGWSSESDSGIYDAMNKGLMKATGRWVIFMNAGDGFYATDTVKKVFGNEIHDAEVIYGAVEIKYPGFSRIEQAGTPDRLWQGMQFSHQSAFIDCEFHQKHLFNISNCIAADLEFFYQSFKSGARFVRLDDVVSRVITGGVSESNRVNTILASRDAICGDKIRPLISLYYFVKVMDSAIRALLKRLLPDVIVKAIILHK